MLEFILDGQIVNEPKGARDLRHRIFYNDALKGYFEQFEGSVSFNGSEYNYLRNRFFADGCSVATVLMRSNGEEYTANIFLNDAEWQPDKCEVVCELVDSSFLSLIDNNKSVKAYVNVPRSKNDLPISATAQTDLLFKAYDTVNNTDTPANRHGVRVYDALKTLVEFMSDGQIGFVSNFFFPDDNPSQSMPRIPTLLTGRAIRTGADDSFPFISFQELYEDLQKLYNLSFSIERVGSSVFLRIEPISYFKQSGSLVLTDAEEVRQEAQRESYYAQVKFGSSKNKEYNFFPSATVPVSLPFVQWTKEEYHLGGQCNTDAALDLGLKTLITDTNIIMRCLPFGSGNPQSLINPPDTDYDEDVFLVVFDGANETITAVNPVDTDLIYYNESLTNQKVAERWGDGVPFPIFQFLGGATSNDAQGVVVGTQPVTTFPTVPNFLQQWMLDNSWFTVFSGILEFPTATPPNGFDPSLNLTNGTYGAYPATYYTAPITTVYTVTANLHFDGDMRGFVIAQIRPSNPVSTRLVNISAEFFTNQTGFPWTNQTATGSLTTVAASGDQFYVICFLGGQVAYPPPAPIFPPVLKTGSFMEVLANGNTITQTYDPADNYLLKSKVRYPITCEWWGQFRANWHQRILLTYQSGQSAGYVNSISRNIYTGDSEVDIVSKFADVTQ